MNIFPREPRKPGPPSFYRQIKAAAGPDGLPEHFTLQKPDAAGAGGVTFMDGAVDGIAMYHTSVTPGELGDLPEILGLISAGDARADARLEEFFREADSLGGASMLCRVDGLQDWIIAHKEELDPGMLYQFSMRTLRESRNTGCVKFALSVLELLDTSGTEAREVISTLALSDEFTLFCSYVIRNWEDGNEEMFRLAKLVHGWGRIFLVHQLEPDRPEIREWMLREGWRNEVLSAYSARRCAQEGGFLELLRRDALAEEDFRLAQGLMEALLDEGPVRNVSAMENGAEILREYLRHVKSRGLSDENAEEKLGTLILKTN